MAERDVKPENCRRCSECVGQEHHFLPIAEWDEVAQDFYYPCKHCDQRAPACFECEEAIWPVVDDSGRCAECKFDDKEANPLG
jgi:hypothetical protein